MKKTFYCGYYNIWHSKEMKLLPCQRRELMLNRLGDWDKFNEQERKHIVQYAEVQYANNEDTKTDQVGMYTPEECMKAIERYSGRFGKGVRGAKEELRDMLKIAHYAQRCYDKLKEKYSCEDVYK